jgi:hypothetical protein
MRKGGGIGLYTYDQTKYMTPFLYFALVVIGVVLCSLGGFVLWATARTRAYEVLRSGAAESHLNAFVFSTAMIVMGLFFAHTGVIYCLRRASSRLQHGRKR